MLELIIISPSAESHLVRVYQTRDRNDLFQIAQTHQRLDRDRNRIDKRGEPELAVFRPTLMGVQRSYKGLFSVSASSRNKTSPDHN